MPPYCTNTVHHSRTIFGHFFFFFSQQKQAEDQDHQRIQAAIANVRRNASESVNYPAKNSIKNSASSSAKQSVKDSVKKSDGIDENEPPAVVPEGEVVLSELGLSQEQVRG